MLGALRRLWHNSMMAYMTLAITVNMTYPITGNSRGSSSFDAIQSDETKDVQYNTTPHTIPSPADCLVDSRLESIEKLLNDESR